MFKVIHSYENVAVFEEYKNKQTFQSKTTPKNS